MSPASDHCHAHAAIQPVKLAELHSRRTIVVALASAAVASSGPVLAQSEASPADERFMRLALDEARQGDYAFGCVITRGDEVIARGQNPAKPTMIRPHMARSWRSAVASPITAARSCVAPHCTPPANRA
jgi:hypothetical protein